jgi:hypothetical protein
VFAHEVHINDVDWIEIIVDVREHLTINSTRVPIQATDMRNLINLPVIQGTVMDVVPEDAITEGHIAPGIEDVRMPEIVDGRRDSMFIERVEQGDAVVLLESQNPFLQELRKDQQAFLLKSLLSSGFDAFEILCID